MQQVAAGLGSASFLRSMQRDLALEWLAKEREKLGIKESPSKAKQQKDKKERTEASSVAPSAVLSKLEMSGRKPMQMKLARPKPKKTPNREQPVLDFGGEDDEDE